MPEDTPLVLCPLGDLGASTREFWVKLLKASRSGLTGFGAGTGRPVASVYRQSLLAKKLLPEVIINGVSKRTLSGIKCGDEMQALTSYCTVL